MTQAHTEKHNTASNIIPSMKGLDAAFADHFTKLIQQVRQTGKKGSITLKIHIQPRDANNDEFLALNHEIKTTLPSVVSQTTYMHADDESALHEQVEISFSTASHNEKPADIKEIQSTGDRIQEFEAIDDNKIQKIED